MNSRTLAMYCFWWSEVRLVVAALALFLGGVPPIYFVAPYSLYAITALGLKLAWIISGLAAGYLLYQWYERGQKLFGRKDPTDTIPFLVIVVSGLNLGIAGIFGRNLGLSVTTNSLVLIIVGVWYLIAAWQLWMKAKKRDGNLF